MKYDNSRPWRRLYNTKRWKQARSKQLALFPLCCMCEAMGVIKPATVVDHKIPHKGNLELFYDSDNHQSLCKLHHDSSKQKAEKKGVNDIGCDSSGIPIDSDHHWNG